MSYVDHQRNGEPAWAHDSALATGLTKRDKRRQQISARLSKLEATFVADKDNFYRGLLHSLQNTLATLQQGTNDEYLEQKAGLEEERDYELTRLRLWEEYQVRRCEEEYQADLARARENHDRMIKLIKEKLYDKLQEQIKQLKEDKLLLNLVNANSWSDQDAATVALNAVAGKALQDRRSLRKREMSSRFTAGEADDLSDSGVGSSSAYGKGYVLAGKRRRHYATRYSSNDEMSSTNASGGAHLSLKLSHQQNASGASSGNDSNLSDKDYDALNTIIMNNDDGGVSLILQEKQSTRPNTRGSHKQFVGVVGLKPEELNDDLNMLRNAIVKRE